MSDGIAHLIAAHGYWIVGLIVGLESMGLPLPGETTLVSAGIYAGSTHHLSVALLVSAAAVGAVVGDNLGFWIGHTFGLRLVLRSGPLLRLTSSRLKLGQYLFHRHGGKVVFFGRFVAVLRTLAALLAGINRMSWWRFLFFNMAGGIMWATIFGCSSYLFGKQMEEIHGVISLVGVALGGAGTLAGLWFARRHETELETKAEQAFPGPIQMSRR